jgi:ectoine hydroxylase-related dioxygenase (phytanoyl-CoA dioxygenase family)
MLSADQKRRFARDGYLLVEDALDADIVDRAREQIRDGIPVDVDDYEAMLDADDLTGAYEHVEDGEPFAAVKQRLHDYGADLVGDALVEPEGEGMQLAVRFPHDVHLAECYERLPRGEFVDGPHLDGYGPGYVEDGEWRGFTVAATVYFDDVVERGGGFTVFPGSHWVAAEYFQDHHLDNPGSAGWLPDVDPEGGWRLWDDFWRNARSRQLSGEAGTVVLWHNKLVHCAGVNQSRNPRMAGIVRMSRDDHDEVKHDATTEPLAYFDGLRDVDVDLSR